jgi:ATP-binding cassette subfamily F protein 3
LNEISTDIIHLDKQQLTAYNGNYEAFVKARIESLKNQQRLHDAQAAQIKHISAFVDRFRYNAKRASLVQSRLKKLEKMTLVPEVVDGTLGLTGPVVIECCTF